MEAGEKECWRIAYLNRSPSFASEEMPQNLIGSDLARLRDFAGKTYTEQYITTPKGNSLVVLRSSGQMDDAEEPFPEREHVPIGDLPLIWYIYMIINGFIEVAILCSLFPNIFHSIFRC